MQEQMIMQSVLNGLMSGVVLILFSLGLTIVFGILRIINFAHGEFYMIGGYVAWLTLAQFLMKSGIPTWLCFIVAIITSMIVGALIGMVIERLLLKPFRGHSAPSLIISLGIIMLLQTGVLLGFGLTDKALSGVFPGVVTVFGATLSIERLIVILTGAVLAAGSYLFLKFTFMGMALRAVAQDPEASTLQGISIDKISSIGMGIGCALAAGAGTLMAPIFYINPFIGTSLLLNGFAVIILGGLGSIPGTILGGLIIGFIQSFGANYLGTDISQMMTFGVLVLVLIVKPRGFFGRGD